MQRIGLFLVFIAVLGLGLAPMARQGHALKNMAPAAPHHHHQMVKTAHADFAATHGKTSHVPHHAVHCPACFSLAANQPEFLLHRIGIRNDWRPDVAASLGNPYLPATPPPRA